METAIHIENLVKQFRGENRRPFRAVDGLNLQVRRGEILGFLGPNGAGKTTTIKMILGLVLPDQGHITVDGLPVATRRSDVLRRVGAVLEGNRNIYWDLTVLENLRYWGTLKEVPPPLLARRISELLGFFELEEKRNSIGKQLSRGMQQKLAIACALIHDPPILLLDEPTLGLDVQAARLVKERVLQLCREQRRTVVLTTHQLDVAQDLCGRVAIIQHGRLKALDETANLLEMFSRQEYEFRLDVAQPPAGLTQYGRILPSGDSGGAFRIVLPDTDALYAVMAALQRSGARVEAVTKVEANLEEVFVQLTAGERPAAGEVASDP